MKRNSIFNRLKQESVGEAFRRKVKDIPENNPEAQFIRAKDEIERGSEEVAIADDKTQEFIVKACEGMTELVMYAQKLGNKELLDKVLKTKEEMEKTFNDVQKRYIPK